MNTLEERIISILPMRRGAVSSASLCGGHGMSDCTLVPQLSVVKHYKNVPYNITYEKSVEH